MHEVLLIPPFPNRKSREWDPPFALLPEQSTLSLKSRDLETTRVSQSFGSLTFSPVSLSPETSIPFLMPNGKASVTLLLRRIKVLQVQVTSTLFLR